MIQGMKVFKDVDSLRITQDFLVNDTKKSIGTIPNSHNNI